MKFIRNIVSIIIRRPIDDNWRVIKTLYHGSQHKIKDGILKPVRAPINGFQGEFVATFATSDWAHALKYAAQSCIGDGFFVPDDIGLFLEKIKKDKINTCYIYEVDSKGFKPDYWTAYYYKKTVKIKKIHKIDINKEIKSGRLKVYRFDNLDVSNISNPIKKMDMAYEHIRAKKYKKHTG